MLSCCLVFAESVLVTKLQSRIVLLCLRAVKVSRFSLESLLSILVCFGRVSVVLNLLVFVVN